DVRIEDVARAVARVTVGGLRAGVRRARIRLGAEVVQELVRGGVRGLAGLTEIRLAGGEPYEGEAERATGVRLDAGRAADVLLADRPVVVDERLRVVVGRLEQPGQQVERAGGHLPARGTGASQT